MTKPLPDITPEDRLERYGESLGLRVNVYHQYDASVIITFRSFNVEVDQVHVAEGEDWFAAGIDYLDGEVERVMEAQALGREGLDSHETLLKDGEDDPAADFEPFEEDVR